MPRFTAASVSFALFRDVHAFLQSRNFDPRDGKRLVHRGCVSCFLGGFVGCCHDCAGHHGPAEIFSRQVHFRLRMPRLPTTTKDPRAPIFTVVIERPRVGGTAINCSQIFSRHVSKSRGGGSRLAAPSGAFSGLFALFSTVPRHAWICSLLRRRRCSRFSRD